MTQSINGSVGIRHNGSTQCHNDPADQTVVIDLLNRIAQADGGCGGRPLVISPRWQFCTPELHQAILNFQRKNKGLSVDGHIDPGGAAFKQLVTLAKPSSVTPITTSTTVDVCAFSPSSSFAGWPPELVATLCRSFKAHSPGNHYLANCFWGGTPANLEAALNRLGSNEQVKSLKELYTRANAIKGLWPFIQYIHNIWSGDSHGFAFTCTDKGKLRNFLDGSISFCRDTPLMMSDHQAVGPAQCWREAVDGTAGLHICIPVDDTVGQTTVAGESNIHIDPHQIVKGLKGLLCDYSISGSITHGKDVAAGVSKRWLERKLQELGEKLK